LLLQVDDDATAEEIKRAYRSMAKECHPDYLGDKGHNICILLNEAYEVTLACWLAAGLGEAGLVPCACALSWSLCESLAWLSAILDLTTVLVLHV
jgi:hypothetical protein